MQCTPSIPPAVLCQCREEPALPRAAVLQGISMGGLEDMPLQGALAMPLTKHPNSGQSCSFVGRRLFGKSEGSSPPPAMGWAHRSTACHSPTTAFEEQHVHINGNGIKEETSFLSFNFNFFVLIIYESFHAS